MEIDSRQRDKSVAEFSAARSAESLRSPNLLVLVLAFAILTSLWIQLPRITDPYAVEDDHRNIFWIHLFEDSSLFSRVTFDQGGVRIVEVGPLNLIFESASPGYGLTVQALSTFVPPLLALKLLIFPLTLITAYFAFKIADHYSGPRAASLFTMTLVVVNLASTSDISMDSGLHRSFIFPIYVALLYFLLRERYVVAAVVVLVGSSIYLPTLPVGLLTLALTMVHRFSWRRNVTTRNVILGAGVAAIVGLVFFPFLRDQVLDAWEGVRLVLSRPDQHMLVDPHHQQGARAAIFWVFPIIGRGGLIYTTGTALNVAVLAVLAAIMVVTLPRSQVVFPELLRRFLYASFLAFLASWLAIILTSSFLLYQPSRYTTASVLIVLLFFVFLNGRRWLAATVRKIAQQQRRLPQLAAIVVVGLAAILLLAQPEMDPDGPWRIFGRLLIPLGGAFVLLALLAFRRRTPEQPAELSTVPRFVWPISVLGLLLASLLFLSVMSSNYFAPGEEERALFAFVETLPKDAMLAGDPCTLDGVPLFAKRSVLMNCERYLNNLDEAGVTATLNAYFAREMSEVEQYCREYGVTHMVVNRRTLNSTAVEEKSYFYEPFATAMYDAHRGQERFALLETPPAERLYESENVFVVGCGDA